MKTIRIADLDLADAQQSELVAWASESTGARRIAFAVHVGGLNHCRRDRSFVDVLGNADLLYADGASVVLLARLAGAQRIERAATTDIGLPVIEAVSATLGRPARIALVGGPEGLARRAGEVIGRLTGATTVLAEHGFHGDSPALLKQLCDSAPDIVIVGMGMPLEAEWVVRHQSDLPRCLILTCGGWMGFLVGEERRAPLLLQRMHLEWAYRLALAPRRLFTRYATGALTVFRLAVRIAFARRRGEQS